jgi:hypothetical protein
LSQVSQPAACDRAYSIDERCARWLLMMHDRVGAGSGSSRVHRSLDDSTEAH